MQILCIRSIVFVLSIDICISFCGIMYFVNWTLQCFQVWLILRPSLHSGRVESISHEGDSSVLFILRWYIYNFIYFVLIFLKVQSSDSFADIMLKQWHEKPHICHCQAQKYLHNWALEPVLSIFRNYQCPVGLHTERGIGLMQTV